MVVVGSPVVVVVGSPVVVVVEIQLSPVVVVVGSTGSGSSTISGRWY